MFNFIGTKLIEMSQMIYKVQVLGIRIFCQCEFHFILTHFKIVSTLIAQIDFIQSVLKWIDVVKSNVKMISKCYSQNKFYKKPYLSIWIDSCTKFCENVNKSIHEQRFEIQFNLIKTKGWAKGVNRFPDCLTAFCLQRLNQSRMNALKILFKIHTWINS